MILSARKNVTDRRCDQHLLFSFYFTINNERFFVELNASDKTLREIKINENKS